MEERIPEATQPIGIQAVSPRPRVVISLPGISRGHLLRQRNTSLTLHSLESEGTSKKGFRQGTLHPKSLFQINPEMLSITYTLGNMLWNRNFGEHGIIQSEPAMFTKMEGASHLQKSNVIVHWFLSGEMWVYDDAFNGEGLLSWLHMTQIMFPSSNIQS